MSRIAKAFEGGKAFIAFITAGDPDLETTEKLVLAMAEAGADLIEIGIPFSDPVRRNRYSGSGRTGPEGWLYQINCLTR